MIDKKIVIGIIVFVVAGMFIYSFANPLESGDSKEQEANTIENELEDVEEDKTDEVVSEEVEQEENLVKEDVKTIIKYVPQKPDSTNNNKGNSGNDTPKPPVVVRSSKTIFSLGEEETSNIQVIDSGSTITYSGTMKEKLPFTSTNGVTYKDYINIVLTSPEVLSEEEFNNVKITYKGVVYSASDEGSQIERDSSGRARVKLWQPFNRLENINETDNTTVINVKTYWGYGEEKSYNIRFSIVVNSSQE